MGLVGVYGFVFIWCFGMRIWCLLGLVVLLWWYLYIDCMLWVVYLVCVILLWWVWCVDVDDDDVVWGCVVELLCCIRMMRG